MENLDEGLIFKVIERRKELKLSQSKIAAELSMSIRTYQRIEHGEGELTISQYLKICKILHVEYTYFLPPSEVNKA